MERKLSAEQSEQVLRFLLYRMGLETRRAMMAELPVAYATLYPTAAVATIAAVVDRINKETDGV